MKNIDETLKIASLLNRSFHQALDEGEQLKLEAWLKARPENRLLYEKMRHKFEHSKERFSDKYDERAENALERVKKELAPKARLRYWRYIPYAAAVAIVIFCGILYQSYDRNLKIITAVAETKEVYLADGSYVRLAPSSKLIYNKSFGKTHRELSLEGEAYFRVEKDEKRPFTVTSNTVKINVLGTTFRLKAYTSEEASILVTSGKVQVESNRPSLPSAVLQSGEEITIHQSEKTQTKKYQEKALKKIDAGIIVYDGVPIRNVVRDLKRSYAVHIDCDEGLGDRLFYGELDTGTELTLFLSKLTLTVNGKWNQTAEKKFIIQKN